MISIKETSTAFIIPKIPKFPFYKLENFFSFTNYQTKEKDPFGIIETETHYRIPKIEYEKLEQLLSGVDYKIEKIGNYYFDTLSSNIKLKNPPKNEIQEDVIKNVIKHFKELNDERVIVSLPTGQGKTYVATNIITKLDTPTIIFMKSVELRKQWVKSFFTHTNIRPDKIAEITGSQELVNLLENGIKYDIIVVTHRTVQKFIELVGMKEFYLLLYKQGIGCKVYDEFDQENSSMFKIETHTNTRYTIYLSATDYKSPDVNRIFQAAFAHVPNYGKNYGIKVDRNALFVMYNSKPDKKTFGRCHRYKGGEFVFDYHKYHEHVITGKTYLPGLKVMWDKVISKRYYDKDMYLKTVFFIARKTTAEQFRDDLSKLTGVPKDNIYILNSDIPAKDREKAMNAKLIISTADSLGRGIDLKDLDTVVDFETRASRSKTTQVVGRVSRSGTKVIGTYIGFIDTAFPTVIRNHNMKVSSGLYDELFTKTYIYNVKEGE